MADQVTDPVEGQDNPERPEWLPENFESPEALARSYTEAQRKITEQAQQLRGLEDSINSLTAQQEQWFEAQSRPDPNDVRAQWLQAIEDDPVTAMYNIAQTAAQQVHQQYAEQSQNQPGIKPEDFAAFVAEQSLSAKYQDFSDPSVRSKISEVIQNDPLYHQDNLWVNPDLATHALDRAYQTVKAQELLSGASVAQQQAADTRAMKLAAQSAVGASGRPDAPAADAEEWARIRSAGPAPYYAGLDK